MISPLDLLFKAMEHENPESAALLQFIKGFQEGAGKNKQRTWGKPPLAAAPPHSRQTKATPTNINGNLNALEDESVPCMR